MFTKVKTKEEVVNMRESGRLLAAVLDMLDKKVEPGLSTKEADEMAQAEIKKLGGKPAFLGYQDFTGAVCISLNDEIVHGIPGPKVMNSGDLVSFDFGVDYRGMITDSAFTKVLSARPTTAQKRLLNGTEAALAAGIDVLHHGVKVGDISHAIERVLLKHKLGILREFVGHGVGHHVHEEPNIPNYGQPGPACASLTASAMSSSVRNPMARSLVKL